MPYSDNLYSLSDDSDGENYADQLSPSDGYFASSSSSHVVPNVPNVLVPDPTLQETSESAAESKAREANEELQASNTQRTEYDHYHPAGPGSSQEPSHLEQRAASSHQRRRDSTSAHTYTPSSLSRTTLRSYPSRARASSVYSDAPPAYSPSPTTPSLISPTNQQSNQSRNYNTFSSVMGVADVIENQRLLGRDPESMGQPGDGDADFGRTPHWTQRVRRRLPTWLTRRTAILGLVVLIVTIGLLASSFRILKEDDHPLANMSGYWQKKTIGADPVKQIPPGSEKEPVTDPGVDEPVVATPFEPSYCRDAQYRYQDQIFALEFDRNQNITFSEDTYEQSGSSQVRVAGQVNLRRLDAGGSPRMVLEIATTDHGILLDVYADEHAQAMKVSVPKKYHSANSRDRACVEMRATIWVPEDADIGAITLRVLHLDILALDDLSLHVHDFARIESVVGDVKSGVDRRLSYNETRSTPRVPDFTFVPARSSYVFDARVIEVSSTSGDIVGNWPLYDLLGVHTTSGNVDVSVTPKNASATDPRAAVLSVSTISGDVQVVQPVLSPGRIPQRDYLVDVKSTSGGIKGALAFGAGIELKTVSSQMALHLLPVVNVDRVSPGTPAQLETMTTSGGTAVRIMEPLWFGAYGPAAARALDSLQALHKSTSGNVELQYPQAWEGNLKASTTSGSLSVGGKDVRIIRSVGGFPGSKLEARKGSSDPGSSIEVRAVMGSLNAVIGNV
ncbi:hypothetical protein GGR53DRAFT_141607 [Hypoxylon sp. FL1150]|nr:hypothetical protein GGR53DRAFT_141607 [Hypoxylon sp. FL1150]